jgi:uncharacterized repeat protein (TIGR03803 family)
MTISPDLRKRPWLLLLVLCQLAAGVAPAASQVSFHPLAYMNQYSQPAGMTEGSPGVFYTVGGGGVGGGAVLSVTASGSETVIATIPSGDNFVSLPQSGANGRLYSAYASRTTVNMLSVSSSPRSAKVYPPLSFGASLTQSLPDGTFLAVGGAVSTFLPNVVIANLKGSVSSLYEFPSTETLAYDALYASDGNYYGISIVQADHSGYVYRLSPSGSPLTKIYTFPAAAFGIFGGYNIVPLLQASDGNLYGVTPGGGANGTGTIYKLTLAGQYTLLYSFPRDNNSNPAALIEASDGSLYGATNGNLGVGGHSLIFRITKTGQYSVVFPMTNLTSQGGCLCYLTQGSDGNIYGSAQVGGIYGGGVLFALSAGLPKPAPRVLRFTPRSGPVGTKVLIWGTNLLSASVSFNGVSSTAVTNGGSPYVTATVPVGATTGPITLTTPGGASTTKASFTVQ